MNNMQKNNLKTQEKYNDLYSGIFWITDIKSPDKNYLFKIPCDISGEPYSTVGLNARSGKTYNHEKFWNDLPVNLTHNKPFNYYPRGRVQIANNKAIVYLNPVINIQNIQEFIKDEFNLDRLKNVKFCADGSDHYKSHIG